MCENEMGRIHIYCGEGAGKTTAAVGLAIRAAGQGLRVVFAQFMKGSDSGEIRLLRKIDNIVVLRNDVDFGFSNGFTDEVREHITKLHNDTVRRIKDLLEKNTVDLLILDEINSAYELGLVDQGVIDKIVTKDRNVEIVLTGRNPQEKFLELANYVSEIKCKKHPFYEGVTARKGIEF